MSQIVILPILLPLVTVAGCLLAYAHRHWQRWISFVGAGLQVVAAIWIFAVVRARGPIDEVIGGWPATLGISLSIDLASAIFVLLTGVIGFTIALDLVLLPPEGRERADGFPLLHALLAGVNGAFIAADLFNLFVWFELLLISSFVLMALGAERPALEGSVKYVAINLVSSAAFLCGLGLAYGACGTLSMADLGRHLDALEATGFRAMLTMLFIGAFSIKAALVPFAAWLPASYHTASPRWSGLFAGLLAKVGIYAILRTGTLVFGADRELVAQALLVLGAASILFGGFGALRQHRLRRLLSFVLVGQMGVLALGAAAGLRGNASAFGGTLLYIVHEGLTMSVLFLIAGRIERDAGSSDIRQISGIKGARAWLLVLPGLAVIGVPPLGGFVGKVALIQTYGPDWPSILILLLSLLTLLAFARVWTLLIARSPASDPDSGKEPVATTVWATWIPTAISLSLALLLTSATAEITWDAAKSMLAVTSAHERLLRGAP